MNGIHLKSAQNICAWAMAEGTVDKVLPVPALLTGILYALTAQAEELEAQPYGPGQDTVTVEATGDDRDQLLRIAFEEAEMFFGPEREFELMFEPWSAIPNPSRMDVHDRKTGRYIASVTFREVPRA